MHCKPPPLYKRRNYDNQEGETVEVVNSVEICAMRLNTMQRKVVGQKIARIVVEVESDQAGARLMDRRL